jgi:membrane associated rhomboid family serine protease
MGSLKFLAFYLAAGVIGVGLQAALTSYKAVGAAGAIAAVLGAYTVLYRGGRVITLVLIPLVFTVAEVPALVLLALWWPMQAAFAGTGLIDWTAFAVQVVTFVLGAATIRALASHRKPIPPPRVA